MKLSVIIPVYNVENYLEECLQSVYKIEEREKEIIIVNDGSTDNSYKIIDKYKSKYYKETKVVNQKNKGLSGARNSGLNIATGRYVAFIDSDDYIDYKKLQELLKRAEEFDLDIALGDLKYLNQDKVYDTQDMRIRSERLSQIDIKSGLDFLEENIDENSTDVRVEVCTNLYRRELLDDNSIRFREGLLHEDTLFTFQVMYYAKKVKYFVIYYYFYRVRQNSIMHTLSKRNYIHKMFIAQELYNLKLEKKLDLRSWDIVSFNLYFGSVRKGQIKNRELYHKIKLNKNLNRKSKIKQLFLVFYHLRAKNVNIILN